MLQIRKVKKNISMEKWDCSHHYNLGNEPPLQIVLSYVNRYPWWDKVYYGGSNPASLFTILCQLQSIYKHFLRLLSVYKI